MKKNESTTFYAVVLNEESIMTDNMNKKLDVYVDIEYAKAKIILLKESHPELDFKIEECEIELLGEVK